MKYWVNVREGKGGMIYPHPNPGNVRVRAHSNEGGTLAAEYIVDYKKKIVDAGIDLMFDYLIVKMGVYNKAEKSLHAFISSFFYILKLNHNDYIVQQRYGITKIFNHKTLSLPEYPLF